MNEFSHQKPAWRIARSKKNKQIVKIVKLAANHHVHVHSTGNLWILESKTIKKRDGWKAFEATMQPNYTLRAVAACGICKSFQILFLCSCYSTSCRPDRSQPYTLAVRRSATFCSAHTQFVAPSYSGCMQVFHGGSNKRMCTTSMFVVSQLFGKFPDTWQRSCIITASELEELIEQMSKDRKVLVAWESSC